jgi:hypothetical protein
MANNMRHWLQEVEIRQEQSRWWMRGGGASGQDADAPVDRRDIKRGVLRGPERQRSRSQQEECGESWRCQQKSNGIATRVGGIGFWRTRGGNTEV